MNASNCWLRFSPEFFKVQLNVGFLPGLLFVVTILITVGNIDELVGEVIDDGLEVSGSELACDVSDSNFSINFSVIFVNEVCEFDIPVGAVPIHSEIDCVWDFRVPGGIGDQVLIIDDIGGRIGHLESSESGKFRFTITDS